MSRERELEWRPRRRPRPLGRAIGAAVLIVAGAVAVAGALLAQTASPPCPDDPLRQVVRRGGTVRVIARLDLGPGAAAEAAARDTAGRRRRIAAVGDRLIRELEGTTARVVRRYRRSPLLALEVDEPALCRLLTSPIVQSVKRDRADRPAPRQ